jgi:pSer/pThr/pTyr-binding forkhead associated (FHA) protein
MKFSLVVTQGSQQGKALPITKTEFSIGRDAKCNLRPASQHVSKRHCVLRTKGEQVFIQDLGSTNGTFVNDEQIKGERELHDGDRLKIGPLDFVVKLETAARKPTDVEKETQVPGNTAAKPAPAPAGSEEHLDDEAIGSMLLSLADEESENAESDFAQGSTLMQVLKPEEMEALQNPGDKVPYRPKQPTQGTASTSNAAKAILEKYRRRPKS